MTTNDTAMRVLLAALPLRMTRWVHTHESAIRQAIAVGLDPAARLRIAALRAHRADLEREYLARQKKPETEEQRVQFRLERAGIRRGAYLSDGSVLLGRVTVWPPRNGVITTDVGPIPIQVNKRSRKLYGHDMAVNIPTALLQQQPGIDIGEVTWNGQTFFVWTLRNRANVATAEGYILPQHSEIAHAVLTSRMNHLDAVLDAAVSKLAENQHAPEWTPIVVKIYGQPSEWHAIAPARKREGLIGFRVRDPKTGDIYQRMADPKGGFLWVRQP